MRAALIAEQQRIALRVVPGAGRPLHDLDQSTITVLPMAGRDSFRDDGASGVLTDMDHLGAGVRLLVMVGQRDRVELSGRVIALQDAARVLPGDRRAGLHLRPGDLGALALALAPFGDKVVDATLPFLVARIPVLDRR